MNKPNDFFSDSLDDLLGGDTAPAPRQLPQDEAFARIRQSGIGHVPVAPTFKINCQKCGGSGRFRSYAGRDCGPCFTCKGVGSFERKNSASTLAANRAKAVDRKVAQMDNRWDHFVGKYPAEAAWILSEKDKFEFAGKMHEAVQKFGDLTINQLAAVQRGLARQQEWAAKRAQKAVQSVQTPSRAQYPKIRAFLLKAKEAGLKAPGFGGKGIALEMAKDNSRNPGCVYVKWQGEYAGKIGSDGVFYVLRAFEGNAELAERLTAIELDPAAWTKLVGIETGSCACCGLTLTDPVSIARGIGPICWGKWGF